MAAADLFVGKAGGLTSSEALARELPVIIINPIPGQEERNTDHLLEAGAARSVNGGNELEVLPGICLQGNGEGPQGEAALDGCLSRSGRFQDRE